MRKKLKKMIALTVSMALVLLTGVPSGDVWAYTVEGSTITLDSSASETLTITEASSNDYVIPNGCELIVEDGGSVTGEIRVDIGGRLTIKEGGTVGSIDGYSGVIDNSGTINGYISLMSDLRNNETGVINGNVDSRTNVTLRNYGKMNGQLNLNSCYLVENYGSIKSVEIVFCTFKNYGTVGTCSFVAESGVCKIVMGENSVMDTFVCPTLNDGFYVTIDVTDGATVKNAKIDSNSLDTSSENGVLNVTESLMLSGESSLDSKINLGVSDGTSLSKNSTYNKFYIHYNGDDFLLPADKFEGQTMSDLFSFTVTGASIAFPDMYVGYSASDISENAKTITLNNKGMCDLKCIIVAVPSFIELYDEAGVLAEDDAIELPGKTKKVLTVKVKKGNAAGAYDEAMYLECWTNTGKPGENSDGVSDEFIETLLAGKKINTSLTVNRKTGAATVSVDDMYYGEAIRPVVTSKTNGTENVTYKYKVKGAENSTYTATAPKKAGEYTIQATFAQTAKYKKVVVTDDFAILRKTGTGSVKVANVYYGDEIAPVATSATNGTSKVTYLYKVKDAHDSTYSKETPTKAGKYTVMATFAQTEEYNKVTATADFAIYRKTGTGTVTASDIYYGGAVAPVATSDTNGILNVSYLYKVKGADDSTYTGQKPTAVGSYTVKATFAQTDEYKAVTATADFAIAYLPAPEKPYSISGKMGGNDYYISDVAIVPADGYLISNALDGEYSQLLVISSVSEETIIYLKKAATGEKTAGITVPALKVDKDAPVFSNVAEGEPLYGEKVEITVQDNDLVKVLVNGEEVALTDRMAILTLSSNLGQETYEITCEDAAGNVRSMTVVVAAEWMKSRTVPSGAKVRLTKEYSYNFGGGTWQVEGDSTSYAGGNTFYVGEDGEYSFTKVD